MSETVQELTFGFRITSNPILKSLNGTMHALQDELCDCTERESKAVHHSKRFSGELRLYLVDLTSKQGKKKGDAIWEHCCFSMYFVKESRAPVTSSEDESACWPFKEEPPDIKRAIFSIGEEEGTAFNGRDRYKLKLNGKNGQSHWPLTFKGKGIVEMMAMVGYDENATEGSEYFRQVFFLDPEWDLGEGDEKPCL